MYMYVVVIINHVATGDTLCSVGEESFYLETGRDRWRVLADFIILTVVCCQSRTADPCEAVRAQKHGFCSSWSPIQPALAS